MRIYAVYIMASESGVLYVGFTNDLDRRVFEHRQKLVPGFSARYNLRKLVYFELFSDVRAAIAREKALKGWLRKRKVALIESVNPEWRDLSSKDRSTRPNGQEVGMCTKSAATERRSLPNACHSEPTLFVGEESVREVLTTEAARKRGTE